MTLLVARAVASGAVGWGESVSHAREAEPSGGPGSARPFGLWRRRFLFSLMRRALAGDVGSAPLAAASKLGGRLRQHPDGNGAHRLGGIQNYVACMPRPHDLSVKPEALIDFSFG